MTNEVTLSEKIYKELYEDITQQRIAPGQSLTLDTLKKKYHVSHTPIREALSRLTSDGLVTYHSNKGMKVVEFSETEIRELFQFTAELEAMAVKFCRGSFTAAPLLAELEHIIREEAEALETDDEERWKRVAGNIHDLFYNYSENRFLRESAARMGARMDVMSNIYSNKETYPAIHKRHAGICQAIKENDFDKAAELVKAHMQFSMVDTLNGLKDKKTH